MVLSKPPRGKWRCVLRLYLKDACPVELFLEQRQCTEGASPEAEAVIKENSAWGKVVWIYYMLGCGFVFGVDEQSQNFKCPR